VEGSAPPLKALQPAHLHRLLLPWKRFTELDFTSTMKPLRNNVDKGFVHMRIAREERMRLKLVNNERQSSRVTVQQVNDPNHKRLTSDPSRTHEAILIESGDFGSPTHELGVLYPPDGGICLTELLSEILKSFRASKGEPRDHQCLECLNTSFWHDLTDTDREESINFSKARKW
jgi:hypothetical protein